MMPAGGADARAEQMATLRRRLPRAADRPRDRRPARRGRGARPSSMPGSAPICARCAAHWAPRDGARRASGRGAVEGARSACEMVWREARPKSDFAAVLPRSRRSLALRARGGAGQGGDARPVALRRAARRVRAGRRARPRSTRCSTDSRGFLPDLLERGAGAPGARAGAGRARRPVPGRAAARARRAADGRARLRFRPRPARRQPASVLRRQRPTTCASPRATTRTTSPAR